MHDWRAHMDMKALLDAGLSKVSRTKNKAWAESQQNDIDKPREIPCALKHDCTMWSR